MTEPFEMTLKRDFNLTRFYLQLRPQYQLSSEKEDSKVKLVTIGHQAEIEKEEADKLVSGQATVAWYFADTNKLKLYNITEDTKLLELITHN